MTAALVILALAVLVVGVTLYSNAQRRIDAAQAAQAQLQAENVRLHRAIGAAQQSMRSLSQDPRLDAALGLEVDMALDDLRRATGEIEGS
jgi:hypothetical protein